MPDEPYRDEDPTRQMRRPGSPLRSPLTGRPTPPQLRRAGDATPPDATRVMPRPAGAQPRQAPGSARPPRPAPQVRSTAQTAPQARAGAQPRTTQRGPGNRGPGDRGPGGRGPGGPGAPRGGASRGARPPQRRRRRPVVPIVLLLVALLIAYPLSLGWTAWSNVDRIGDLATSGGTPGTTFLLVGSDSRAQTVEEDGSTSTDTTGSRTDTILLLHSPSGGGPTVMVSLPRDSYVDVPGSGMNKLNASYALGGPALLVATVEQATGLGIDGYVETGFDGFSSVVDALGGVEVCLPDPIEDSFADIDLPAGCQTLQGQDALGLVRTRKTDATGDLARVQRQRQLLGAIVDKTASPGVLLDPTTSYPAARAGGSALAVDEGTGPLGLARFLLAMRSVSGGGGVQLTVPVSDPDLSTPVGSAVEWDEERADRLWDALREDDTRAVAAMVEKWTAEEG